MDKFMAICVLVPLLALFNTANAVISAWTVPVIGTADGSAGVTTVKFPDSLAAGTSTGITVAATTATSYSITSQPTSGMFTIANTGEITFATGTLDYATATTYVLVIEGVDGDPSTGTATVTISLTDAPNFSTSPLEPCIVTGSATGTTLTTVSASDADSGDTITYSINSGNTNTDFAIVGSTGVITAAASFATTTATSYTLIVHAVDAQTAPGTGTATLWVSVKSNCSSGASAVIVGTLLTLLMALLVTLK